jgi:phospholipase/lecithinase/hemolysin
MDGSPDDTKRRHFVRFTPTSIPAIASAIFLLGAAPASAFDHLWVFGDSTVDTGWYNFRPSGEPQFDKYLSTYNFALPPNFPPTYGMGRGTSNPGPVSVEVVARLIGTEVRPADEGLLVSLPLPAQQAFTAPAVASTPPGVALRGPNLIGEISSIIGSLLAGTNYATGGSRNHDTNPPNVGLFPNAVPTETQIANYKSVHRPDPNSLYLISSGGNDVAFAINQLNADGWPAYVTGAADSLAAAILTLQQGGARFIMVTNLPENFGTGDQMTLRHLYNTELMSKLTALGVSFAWADMNHVRQMIVGNPARFGITHTTNKLPDRACTTPAETTMITSAWAYVCSPSSPVSQPVSTTFAEQALFSDDEHWATGGHSVLGSYYYCLAGNTWPQQFPQPVNGFFFPRSGPQPPIACTIFFPPVILQALPQ